MVPSPWIVLPGFACGSVPGYPARSPYRAAAQDRVR